jgi:DNA gyrase subunit A
MGVKTIQVTEKKGRLAGMKIVLPQHELMLISQEGVVIRVKAEDISRLGRSTQGVKVMNVGDADRVVAIARVTANKKKKKTVHGPAGHGRARGGGRGTRQRGIRGRRVARRGPRERGPAHVTEGGNG